ncbi:hypothetical protein DFH06DRAFT_213137 [Mycena polygramma]|nr:hypothetical protein DFH06DRAFT_213137 [Mycena polygramma]
MSLMYSLPNELIVAIVAAGQENLFDSAGTHHLQPVTSKSEWIVSHLSRRFREVVVGAPSLWTLVEANLDTAGAVEILKLYLERSRAYTISLALHVDFQEMVESDGVHSLAKWLREISPHFIRAGTLRIVVRSMVWDPLLLPPFWDIAAPNLQHLEIIMEIDTDVGTSADIFSSGAPTKLSFLRTSGWTLP